jgi:hypothetical protein
MHHQGTAPRDESRMIKQQNGQRRMVNPEEWIPHFQITFEALMCDPNADVAPKVVEFLKDMDKKRHRNKQITKRQSEFLAVIFFRDVLGISVSMSPRSWADPPSYSDYAALSRRERDDDKKNAYVYFRELLGDDCDLDSFLDK